MELWWLLEALRYNCDGVRRTGVCGRWMLHVHHQRLLWRWHLLWIRTRRVHLTSQGAVLASGGEFNDTESIEVCLGSGFGCTDETACNFDADATTDDGS